MTQSSKKQTVLIYEQAIQGILNLIHERQMNVGDRLPAERELAECLHISRSSLREALHVLAANNVLSIRRSSGIYIMMTDTDISTLRLRQSNETATMKDIKDQLDTRILLETYAFCEAAKIITPGQLQSLYRLEDETFDHLLTGMGQEHPYGVPTIAFEHSIVQLQHNDVVTTMHRQLCAIWRESFHSINAVAMPPITRHRDHLAILEAIRENRESKIRKAVSTHLIRTRSIIEGCLNTEAN